MNHIYNLGRRVCRLNLTRYRLGEGTFWKGKEHLHPAWRPGIKWRKADPGTEPQRAWDEFPWFWGWDEKTQDFADGREFDGKRWNDLQYTNEFKKEARARRPPSKGKA